MILPFSFQDSRLTTDGSGNPIFQFHAYQESDTTDVPTQAEAQVLYEEVHSIHKVWPSTKIVVMAQSLGGDLAELYWGNYWQSEHDNVVRVFTGDSPINGFSKIGDCNIPVVNVGCYIQGVSHLAPLWESLWENVPGNDGLLTSEDGGWTFVPIGTPGDTVMAQGDAGNGQELLTQTFGSGCTPDGGGWDCTGIPAPGYVSPCPPTNPAVGSESHGYWKLCPWITDMIVGLVEGRYGPSSPPPTPDGTTPPNPPTDPSILSGTSPGARRPVRTDARRQQPSQSASAVVPASLGGPLGPRGAVKSLSAVVGASLSISGQHFGTVSGQVSFTSASGIVDGTVTHWSDTEVTVTVPADATTGLVYITPPHGPSVPVGSVTITETPNNVAKITASYHQQFPGAPATITATATDSKGSPVPGANVTLSDGVLQTQSTTNTAGEAVFTVGGLGGEEYVLYSGSTTTTLNVLWPAPPSLLMSLSIEPNPPVSGSAATVIAQVTNLDGTPVSGQTVEFLKIGPPSVTLDQTTASTGADGRAIVHVTDTASDIYLISGSVPGTTITEDASVRGEPQPPRPTPTPSFTTNAATVGRASSFDGSGSTDGNGQIVAYRWNFGDGNDGSGPEVKHVYSAAGIYTVALAITDGFGSQATSTQKVTVTGVPSVTSVNPNAGPVTGGTAVTITGTNFTGATAVKFGSANAASFTVNSNASITAVSPAGTGSVDVAVTTPAGASAISQQDRFQFEPDLNTGPGGGGSGPSGGGSGPESRGSGGVLGFSTTNRPTVTVSGQITGKSGVVFVPLHCAATSGSCQPASVQLTVVEQLRGRRVTAIVATKKGKATKRTVVIGNATVTLGAGQSQTVRISLNTAGKKLLALRKELPVRVQVTTQGHVLEAKTVTMVRSVHKGKR